MSPSRILYFGRADEETRRLSHALKEREVQLTVSEDLKALGALALGEYTMALVPLSQHPWTTLRGELRRRGEGLELAGSIVVTVNPAARASALAALRGGVFGFLLEPIDAEEVELMAERVRGQRALSLERAWLLEEQREALGGEGFPGRSRASQQIRAAIRQAAQKGGHGLIIGESAAERDWTARAIHLLSPQSAGPYRSFDCALSQIRGHGHALFAGSKERRTAYPWALGGTLLLDHVCLLDKEQQQRLLSALSGKTPPRARILGGCHLSPDAKARRKLLQGELPRALTANVIELPPLRERRQDIPEIAEFILRELSFKLGSPPKRLSPEAAKALSESSWRDNPDELARVLGRAFFLSLTDLIEAHHFPLEEKSLDLESLLSRRWGEVVRRMDSSVEGALYDIAMRSVEKPLLKLVMEKTGGNQLRAAGMLGLNRNTLRRKLKELGLGRTGRG